MNLSGTATGFEIQPVLGFTFRTYTSVSVLPLSKIFLTLCKVFHLFLQLGFASSSIKNSDTQQPRRLWIY